MGRIRVFILILIFFPLSIFSADTSKGNNQPLSLKVTFPAVQDTFGLDKVRVTGIASTNARVYVNNSAVKLYPNGAFVTRVDLRTGDNFIKVRAETDAEKMTQEIYVLRPQKPESFPETPTAVDTLMMEPAENRMIMPGEYINVKVKASPGAQAWFSIDKIAKDIPMVELPPEQANGLRGVYNGTLFINAGPVNRALDIKFEIHGIDGSKKVVDAPGKLYVMSTEVPVIGKTVKETWMFTTPGESHSLYRIPENIQLQIIGKVGARFKVKLKNSLSVYIEEQDITLLAWGTPLPFSVVSAPVMSENNDWYILKMPVTTRIPFNITQSTDPAALDVSFFGGVPGSQWITFPSSPTEIKRIKMTQLEDQCFQVRVELDQKQQWGHRGYYEDQIFILKIRKTPRIAALPFGPLTGLVIAVDAGHGGKNEGAVSPAGVLEKDLNLRWAKIFKDTLTSAGASVVMTRMDDIDLELAERIDIARKQNSLIFVSLHNNSVGANGNPLSARGVSAYFTLAQNMDLVWTIYPWLTGLGLAPYGRVYNSYFVTRATDMLSILIEGGFLSHPEEELLLTNDQFLKKMSAAIVKGLEDFVNKQRKN